MARILIISFSNLKTDPRVNRQIRGLSKDYQIIAAGNADPEIPGVKFIPIPSLKKSLPWKAFLAATLAVRAHELSYWLLPQTRQTLKALGGLEFDLIIANDIETLPLALKLAKKNPVVFDAHEYSPLEAEEYWTFRHLIAPLRTKFCARYLKKTAAMMTVCDTIADKYNETFGVRPIVVTNASEYRSLKPHGLARDPIQLVYHGSAAPERGLEELIDAVKGMDSKYYLNFVLVGNSSYTFTLKARASKMPNVKFHDPVPMREIPEWLNQFDVGVYLLPPSNFNNAAALPNKFFEFIQARLALIIGPSPEMASIVRKLDLGIITPGFKSSDLHSALESLTCEQVQQFKKNSDQNALALSAEANGEKIRDLVNSVLTI